MIFLQMKLILDFKFRVPSCSVCISLTSGLHSKMEFGWSDLGQVKRQSGPGLFSCSSMMSSVEVVLSWLCLPDYLQDLIGQTKLFCRFTDLQSEIILQAELFSSDMKFCFSLELVLKSIQEMFYAVSGLVNNLITEVYFKEYLDIYLWWEPNLF